MTIKLSRRQALAGLSALALPTCRSSETGFDADVIIIGAGLSGLHAARLLEAEGKDVLILEASSRIGGRLYTLDHGDLGYTEGGGEQVGASYARILDTADQLGVELEPENTQLRSTGYYYQGQLYGPDEWKTLDTHPFSGSFAGAGPASPLFALAAQENPLASATDWRDEKFGAYDISADSFLQNKGLSEEARRVVDIALNGNSLDSYSMMNLYRSLQLYSQSRDMGPSLSVKGGAQRLTEAMAKSLSHKPVMDEPVSSITAKSEKVTVTARSGQTYNARYCICTIPFGALRRLELNGVMPPSQTAAIKNLPYTQIFQVHFQADIPFWEQDGLPADMWTDSPIERVFASRDQTGSPTGVFRAWINGSGAAHMASLPGEDARQECLETLARIRPATQNQVKILNTVHWTSKNPLAGGAYMHWAPGQISQWANDMATPSGRLSFAGEHLSYLHTGMEGAMESAENAAFGLMDI